MRHHLPRCCLARALRRQVLAWALIALPGCGGARLDSTDAAGAAGSAASGAAGDGAATSGAGGDGMANDGTMNDVTASGGSVNGGVASAGAAGASNAGASAGDVIVVDDPSSSCLWRPIGEPCIAEGQYQEMQCFTLAELSDPCSGTHRLSVHVASDPPETDPNVTVTGDGGTDDCPSADELYWGDAGSRCGCFDTPACVAPTTQRGSSCCYPAVRLCRLC